jgi:hypothetical protein
VINGLFYNGKICQQCKILPFESCPFCALLNQFTQFIAPTECTVLIIKEY